jgi:hypothetical protein
VTMAGEVLFLHAVDEVVRAWIFSDSSGISGSRPGASYRMKVVEAMLRC